MLQRVGGQKAFVDLRRAEKLLPEDLFFSIRPSATTCNSLRLDAFDGPTIAVSTQLVIVMDWMALILMDTQVAQPKSACSFQSLCPCYEFSTEDKLWWFLGNSPSRRWSGMASRRAGPLQFIGIDALMYDGMHGCARMHSIAWSAALIVADSRQRAFLP